MDLWSLGVITYILYSRGDWSERRLCGYPPFPQSNDFAALRLVVSGAFQFHEAPWSAVSEEAKEFIAALLVPNPHHRATAKQACSMRWMQFESTRTMHMNSGGAQFVSLVSCGVRDNPSLARGMTSRIPARG